jgi:3-deoxy-D-manno-octulosonic-acid transferase
LLVPRHPQRFDEVAALLAQQGWRFVRRSDAPADGALADADLDVWLGDSVGEMPAYYAAADVALLGGSFAPLGGQNLIEAAACGCPVVMGPHTFNFADAAERAIAAQAAWRVPDIAAGVARAFELAAAPGAGARVDSAAQVRQRVRDFADQHRGSSARSAVRILALVPAAKTPPDPRASAADRQRPVAARPSADQRSRNL